jgi:hypothetical protein
MALAQCQKRSEDEYFLVWGGCSISVLVGSMIAIVI